MVAGGAGAGGAGGAGGGAGGEGGGGGGREGCWAGKAVSEDQFPGIPSTQVFRILI